MRSAAAAGPSRARAARAGRASRGRPTARPRRRAPAAARRPGARQPRISSEHARRSVVGGAHVLAVVELGDEPRRSRPAPGPSSSSSSSIASSAASARNMSTSGANGIPSPPSSTQPPTSTRAPASSARLISSSTSRDLPTPASPPTSDRRGLSGDRPLQGAIEHRELSLTTDQHRADEAGGHSVIFPVQSPGAGLAAALAGVCWRRRQAFAGVGPDHLVGAGPDADQRDRHARRTPTCTAGTRARPAAGRPRSRHSVRSSLQPGSSSYSPTAWWSTVWW